MLLGVGLAACLGGGAPAPLAPDAWIQVRPGRQCEFTPAVRDAIREEQRARLETLGVRPRALHVAPSLDALPGACQPEGGVRGLAARAADAGQQDVTELLSMMACAACGCPEPWFVCLRAEVPDEDDLAPLGFLRLR
ncbi:MAG: hypothetical protein R3263_10815 [Myxococcota bacterium]|nr:hypothetical protein [Myxococcota bacterium]